MACNVPIEQMDQGEMSLQAKIEAQRNKLEEIVESRFGLVSMLRTTKVLTPKDQEEIEGKNTTQSKNQKLLDLIFQKGKYQEFIDALQHSGQTHIVNWINGNGVYNPEFDLDWPLTDKEIDILDCNYNWLGEVLGLKEGLNELLFSSKAINVRQRDFISSKPTSCEANEAFLKILRQSSLKIYFLTAHCLRDSKDCHIATVLENVTASVPIHVTLKGESVDEDEDRILNKVVNLRLEKNAPLEEEDVDIFLVRLRMRIMAAKKGNSIVLSVGCFNIGEFHYLCTKVDNNEMKKILERLFSQLLQNLQPNVLLVTIAESDRKNAEKVFEREFQRDKKYDEHFQRLRSQLKYEPMEVTTGESVEEGKVEELPQEAEDHSTSASAEVEKHVVKEVVEEGEEEEAKKQKAEQSSAMEHDSEEEEIVGKTRAPRTIVRTEFEILATILRDNFDYFVEFMVPKVLIDRLHAEECLTDEETRYIKTLPTDRDKSDEIIRVIRGIPSKYNVFVNILREKGQYRVAEVADRGGAVIKVSITFGKQTNSADIQQKIYNRTRSLLSKTGPFSVEVLQVVSLLARAGVEIIEATNSRYLSLWLWCRSEFALRRFNEMNESSNEELSKFFSEFFALLDISDQIPPIMNIDLDDQDKCAVLRQSSFTRVDNLAVGQHSVCAVTSHENNVYALSRNPTAILVFAVDNLSSIRHETLVPDVKDPVDIVSINEFVFVSDSKDSCIWQITMEPYQVKSSPVRAPYTMSVLQGCNILKASHYSHGQPSTLNIYDPDFNQVKEISLPLSIQFPCYAVGTLANTFIVSYKEEAGPSGGLCEVNSSGDVLSIFDISLQAVQGVGSSINQSLSRLNRSHTLNGYPEHITLNERDDIFATDRSKGGILVYNSRLMLEDILEKDSIKRPLCIHYAVNSTLLLVAVDEEQDKSEVVILKHKRDL